MNVNSTGQTALPNVSHLVWGAFITMKKLFLLFVFVFGFTACGQENTVAYEDSNDKTYSKYENTVETKMGKVSREDREKIDLITKNKLNQEKPYLITSFTYNDKIYWSAIEMKTMAKIYFYGDKNLKNINIKNKKYKKSYQYIVKNNLFIY